MVSTRVLCLLRSFLFGGVLVEVTLVEGGAPLVLSLEGDTGIVKFCFPCYVRRLGRLG
jgi:hypothetical protein